MVRVNLRDQHCGRTFHIYSRALIQNLFLHSIFSGLDHLVLLKSFLANKGVHKGGIKKKSRCWFSFLHMPYVTTHIKREVGLKLYNCSHILGTPPYGELPQTAPCISAFENFLGGQRASAFHLSTMGLSYHML